MQKKDWNRIFKKYTVNETKSVFQIKTKPTHTSSHKRNTNLTIRRTEPLYTSQIKGSKLKIKKRQNKYLLKIINVYAPYGEITN